MSWYDGHPDVPRTWPLEAQHVAVLGAGNVALDVARILAKHADDLLPTELPGNVYEILKASPVTDVHVFARRGPAQVKFSPLELRELGHVPDVDVIVYPEDFDFDEGSMAAIHSSNQTKQVVKTLTDWTLKEPEENTASRRIHLHFLHKPVEILGEDGHVVGMRTERTALNGDGNVTGTGQTHDWPVQAVYRAVGYFGSPLVDIPFDDVAGVIPNREGRVVDVDGEHLQGVYATGWIKRGPVGLIGHTKSDASETIRHLGEDVAEGGEAFYTATDRDPSAVVEFLTGRSVDVIQWSGWELLDAYERGLGEPHGRERIKVVPRDHMVAVSLGAVGPAGVSRGAGRSAGDPPEELARAVLLRVAEHLRGRPALVDRPSCRKQTSSATSRAKPISCVATTMVSPVCLSSASSDEDLADELRVERAGHLVEQHHGGLADEGAGDRDALLLAAGELVGKGLGLARPARRARARPAPRPRRPCATVLCTSRGASVTLSSTRRCGNRL